MEKAKLIQMKKNLEIPSIKGIASSKPFNAIPVTELKNMTYTVGVVIPDSSTDSLIGIDDPGIVADTNDLHNHVDELSEDEELTVGS